MEHQEGSSLLSQEASGERSTEGRGYAYLQRKQSFNLKTGTIGSLEQPKKGVTMNQEFTLT